MTNNVVRHTHLHPSIKYPQTAMRVCGAAGKLEKVLELLERMRAATKGNGAKGPCFLRAMVDPLCSHAHSSQALKVLQEMKTAGLKPNLVNYDTVRSVDV